MKNTSLVSYALIMLVLTGCTVTPEFGALQLPEVTTTAEPDQVIEGLYPDCDTEEVQPLTEVINSDMNVYGYDCPTDRQTPEAALAFDPPMNDFEACKLIETSAGRKQYQDTTVGFPRSDNEYRLPDGNHNIVVIPVQWPDLKGEANIMDLVKPSAEKVDKWYSIYSRGKVSFNWQFYDGWITLPEESNNYSQSEAQQNTSQWGEDNVRIIDKFWSQALAAADPLVDFTDVEMVFFVLPTTQDVVSEFNLWPPGTSTFQTDEGPISRGYTPGNYHFRGGNEVWMFWTHEMLHYFKMPDLYWVDQNSVKRTEFTLAGPIQNIDMLSNQGGVVRSLDGWLMWLAGWMDDQEIYCLTPDTFQQTAFEIFPISEVDTSLKSVVLKLSDSSAVVIETRRLNELDSQVEQRSFDGVIVYHVDLTIGGGEGPLTVLAPQGRTLISGLTTQQNMDTLDYTLFEGNSIDIAGYHITVNEHKLNSDVVSISRIADWQSGSAPTYVCHTKVNRDMSVEYELSCPIVY